MRSGRPVYLELGLAPDLVDRGLVSELSHELVRLDVDVLLAWGRLRRFHVPSEELLRRLGSLLLKVLRVVLPLVRLEKLVWVGAGRNDHGGVGATPEDALVVHDVLGVVLLLVGPAIGVLILLLLSDDAGVGGETLATLRGLLHHF